MIEYSNIMIQQKLFLECDESGVGAGFILLQNFVVDIQDDVM